MTDANLMDADCIHGVAWYECQVCDKQPFMKCKSQFFRKSTQQWEDFDTIFDLDTTIERTRATIKAGSTTAWRVVITFEDERE